jgi:hypothetical protein
VILFLPSGCSFWCSVAYLLVFFTCMPIPLLLCAFHCCLPSCFVPYVICCLLIYIPCCCCCFVLLCTHSTAAYHLVFVLCTWSSISSIGRVSTLSQHELWLDIGYTIRTTFGWSCRTMQW